MQPTLKRRPSASVTQDIDKLIKTDDWATAPARDAVQSTVVEPPAPNSPAALTAGQGGAGQGSKLPWEDANPRVKRVFNLSLPEPMHLQLKYLGETTLGMSMHAIAVRAIEAEIKRMLRR